MAALIDADSVVGFVEDVLGIPLLPWQRDFLSRHVVTSQVRCEIPGTEEHPAHVAVRCRACSAVQVLCWAHLEQMRSAAVFAHRRSRVIVCSVCQAHGEDFAAVAEVVPL